MKYSHLRNTPPPEPWSRYIPEAYLMACTVHCHLFRSRWGCRAKSRMLCKSTLGFLAWYQGNSYHSPAHTVYPLRLPPCVRISSWGESGNCHAQLGLSDNHIMTLPHPNGTVWQPNTVHSRMGIRHINWISLCFKYMRNPLVSWSAQTVHPPLAPWIARIPATLSPLYSYKPSSYAIVWGTSVVGRWHTAFVDLLDEIE